MQHKVIDLPISPTDLYIFIQIPYLLFPLYHII